MSADLIIARHKALLASYAYHKARRDHKPSKALWKALVKARNDVLKAEVGA